MRRNSQRSNTSKFGSGGRDGGGGDGGDSGGCGGCGVSSGGDVVDGGDDLWLVVVILEIRRR